MSPSLCTSLPVRLLVYVFCQIGLVTPLPTRPSVSVRKRLTHIHRRWREPPARALWLRGILRRLMHGQGLRALGSSTWAIRHPCQSGQGCDHSVEQQGRHTSRQPGAEHCRAGMWWGGGGQPQPQHKPQPVGANPTVPHTRGQDPVADMPDTLPGNWYQVLGVRYPRATTEEIKRAYKQPSVKLHPDKNTHHKEKAEGLFKQIGKAKDGLLDTEARRRHDADIQRGDRRQQREVRQCSRGAVTHDPGQEGRRPGEPNTLTMQRRFAYVTVDFMEAQYTSIVRACEWQLACTPMPNMTRGKVWYLICPGLTMPVVRVRIVAVGVYTLQCSCHPHGVCYTHGECQPVVHIDGDLPGENVLVSQPGRLLPTDRLAKSIAAASRRR